MISESSLIGLFDEYVKSIPKNLHYVNSEQLRQWLQNERWHETIFLLDNRTEEAFSGGHIEGAVNIPTKKIFEPENLSKLPKHKKIIVCCWVGHTASQILTMLRLLGYDAIGLKFGMGESAIEGESVEGWAVKGYEQIK